MRRPSRRWFAPLLAAPLLLTPACKSDAPKKTGPGPDPAPVEVARPEEPPDDPLPALRTGTLLPGKHDEIAATFAAYRVEGDAEYVDIRVPIGGDDLGLDWDRLRVEIEGGAPGHLAVLASGTGSNEAIVLVRRPKTAAGPEPLRGALYAQSWQESTRGWVRVPFAATGKPATADDRELAGRWATAVATVLEDTWTRPHPWFQFAAGRLRAWMAKQPGGKSLAGDDFLRTRPARTDLTLLMDTTTGVLSMQEALQHDRGLRLRSEQGPRTVPIADLHAPPLDAHPFAAMQAALPNPNGGVAEPLAAAAPPEFWYARFDDIRLMLRLLDEADTWITPVVQIMQQNPEDRGLAQRYQRQLGLRRTGLAKLFGHTVVGHVAVVGSDAYVREGTDVTLIFQLKQPEVFDAELASHLEAYRGEVPGVEVSSFDVGGIAVSVAADPTGAVRQHRARVGDLALVSNSPNAIRRVIAAAQGQAPRLGDEPDLKYMLARDPGEHQAFVFLSDKFIGSVVGPQQKILAARRQSALADLLTPGYAALLHGWLFGQAPASADDLVKSGLLAADELRHPDGDPIAFAPGQPARSRWGTPSALTPLIDLPPVDKVSEAERDAYDNFSRGYQNYWKQFIDPVSIRLDIKDEAAGALADIDVRVLPLISSTDYSDIEEVVGKTRVKVAPQGRGLMAVWGVGQDSRLRRDLDQMMGAITGKRDVGLGWLGDWVAAGLDDRAAVVDLFAKFDKSAQLAAPKTARNEFDDLDMWQKIGKFPLWGAAEVKNPTTLVATLAALKSTVDSVAPGMVEWGEVAKHRDLPIVRIGLSPSAPLLPNKGIADAFAVHYAQTGAAIVVAFDRPTLTRVIDRMLDGGLPKAGEPTDPQFVFDTRSQAGGALWTTALWMLQGQANGASASALRSAEVLLRGDPQATASPDGLARLGLAYLGFTPLNAHGTPEFVLRGDGPADPVQGSAIAPVYPALPIPGSPLERLMTRLTSIRGEVAFDKEPDAAGKDARSLHTHFQIHLGAAP